MITKLRVENYRSIGEEELDLGRLNVLVGQNGAGKSNILDALHFLSDALRLGLDVAVTRRHGITRIRRWAPHRPRNVMVQVEASTEDLYWARYRVVLRSEAEGNYSISHEEFHGSLENRLGEFWFRRQRGSVEASEPQLRALEGIPDDALLVPLRPSFEAHLFVEMMGHMGFYSIFPNALREPQSPGMDYPLEPHGDNLAAVLRGIEKQEDSPKQQIEAALSKLVPELRAVQVRAVGSHLVVQFNRSNGSGRGHWMDSSQESDGTLRMLGILTALYQTPPLSLVAIEEPELTIHPGMLATLRDVIVETAEKRSQVIITTHSPDLMSMFDVDCLKVVEMTPKGTKVGPVAANQQEAIRQKLFLPGELARSEGLQRDKGADGEAGT